jgi:hypothetical protein
MRVPGFHGGGGVLVGGDGEGRVDDLGLGLDFLNRVTAEVYLFASFFDDALPLDGAVEQGVVPASLGSEREATAWVLSLVVTGDEEGGLTSSASKAARGEVERKSQPIAARVDTYT